MRTGTRPPLSATFGSKRRFLKRQGPSDPAPNNGVTHPFSRDSAAMTYSCFLELCRRCGVKETLGLFGCAARAKCDPTAMSTLWSNSLASFMRHESTIDSPSVYFRGVRRTGRGGARRYTRQLCHQCAAGGMPLRRICFHVGLSISAGDHVARVLNVPRRGFLDTGICNVRALAECRRGGSAFN